MTWTCDIFWGSAGAISNASLLQFQWKISPKCTRNVWFSLSNIRDTYSHVRKILCFWAILFEDGTYSQAMLLEPTLLNKQAFKSAITSIISLQLIWLSSNKEPGQCSLKWPGRCYTITSRSYDPLPPKFSK